MTMWHHRVKAALLAFIAAFALPTSAQWSTMTLQSWDNQGFWDTLTSGVETDVVHLSPGLFTDQVFANPHVFYDGASNWIITGYGDSQFGSAAKGDSVYVIKRTPNGAYERFTDPVLSWSPASSGSNWTSVGALDAGVGVAKTPSVTATDGTLGAYKYFMLVPVWQQPDAAGGTRWVSWAVSKNGTSWEFVNETGTGTTNDPGSSLRLIRRTGGTFSYHHPVMMFNPNDQYFYISLGYGASYGGIRATWWRIKFTPGNPFGLYKAPNASSFTVERLNGSNYTATDGTLPTCADPSNLDCTGWPDSAADPKSTPGGMGYAADPLDLVYLSKADGSFDSILFIYKTENGFSDATEAPIYYVRGTQPTSGTGNFVFGTPKRLDLSALRSGCNANPFQSVEPCYRQCSGAGRGYYLNVNQTGTDAFGKPEIYGFITAFREDLHPELAYIWNNSTGQWVLGCQEGSAGVIPAKFRLQ